MSADRFDGLFCKIFILIEQQLKIVKFLAWLHFRKILRNSKTTFYIFPLC